MFKSRKRRTGRRRTKRLGKIVRSVDPIPRKFLTTLRYVDRVVLNAGLGTVANHLFRCASIFDPDETGVGHQPMGRDEIAQLYTKYLVVGAKIRVEFVPTNVGPTTNNGICGIRVHTGSNIVSSQADMLETRQVKWRTYGNTTSTNSVILNASYNPKRLFSVKDVVDDPDFGALLGSSPVRNPTFQIFSVPVDASVDNATVVAIVTIDYNVMWREPITLLGS